MQWRGGARGGTVQRWRGDLTISRFVSSERSPRVVSRERRDERARKNQNGRQRDYRHGLRGRVEASHSRRLWRQVGTRRLQLWSPAGAAELRPLPQPQAEDRAERPQALLQVPLLYLWEVPSHRRQAEGHGSADGVAASPSAGRSAGSGSGDGNSAARDRIGQAGASDSEGS